MRQSDVPGCAHFGKPEGGGGSEGGEPRRSGSASTDGVPPFRVLALLFPVLYYIFSGLWRKGLLFFLLSLPPWLVADPRAALRGTLQHFYLTEVIAVAQQVAAMLPITVLVGETVFSFLGFRVTAADLASVVMVLPSLPLFLFLAFFFTGRWQAALFTALGFTALCLAGLWYLPELDLGEAGPALLWIFSLEVWQALGALLLYAFLTGRTRLGVVVLVTGTVLVFTPFPLVGVSAGPLVQLCLGVVAGVQAPQDVERKRAGQQFWW